MSNRDRGLKKWHGFFMPEHSGELKNIWHEDKKNKNAGFRRIPAARV